MAKRRKPPKRRNPVAKALRSPALRQRVVPSKKKKIDHWVPWLRQILEDGGPEL